MKKTKKTIKYSKERVIISDTLPYETPITFSNRHFYNFLNEFDVNYIQLAKDDKISWSKNINPRINNVVEEIIKILFDISKNNIDNSILIDKKTEHKKIPFIYKITHKEKDFRELSIPHPKGQLELINFYEKYKELILFYSQISPFSIRRPYSVAKFIFSNDKLHSKNIGDNTDIIEDNEKEYESLKTFFTYKTYSNIYKFYEDYRYHRAEKKYNKMFRFDIAKCFDSIYTHSISWAIYNKEIIKDNIGYSANTFPGKFDTFMSNVNYGETNGIIIGPEFSRIFAELILQQIDKSVEIELRKDFNLIYKIDYEVYRYVDDFFVFYNDDITKDKILSKFKYKLQDFKMSIGESKTIYYDKPLITELTIAKEKIVELFENKIKFKIHETVDGLKFKELDFRCNSNHLITKFKIIIKESNVEYKNIMNYTLAIINKRITRILKKFEGYYSSLVKLEFHNELNDDDLKKKK